MTTRNLGPIRDPEALAAFLGNLMRHTPPGDDTRLVTLFRSELSLLAIALDTHAAEVAIKAKRAWVDLQDEPETIRTFDPAIPWVDPRQPGAYPVVGFEPWLDGRAMQRAAEIETERRKAGVGVIRPDDELSPSSSAPPRPSCSPAFGISYSTHGTVSSTAPVPAAQRDSDHIA